METKSICEYLVNICNGRIVQYFPQLQYIGISTGEIMPEWERGELLKTYFYCFGDTDLDFSQSYFPFYKTNFLSTIVSAQSRKSSKLFALLENKIFDSNSRHD